MSRIEELEKRLNPRHRELARVYIDRYADLVKGVVTLGELYQSVYIEQDNREVASNSFSTLMTHGTPLRLYIDALLEQSTYTRPKLRTLDETRADLEAMATADITDLITWRTVEQEDGSKIPIPRILDVENVPKELRRLIRSVTFTKNGPKIEVHDQLKAQDMLNRMNAAYVDRTEITGKNGSPIALAVASVTPDELTNICRKLLEDI